MSINEVNFQVLHNIAIAEYSRDGCSDPKRLLEVLYNIKVFYLFLFPPS